MDKKATLTKITSAEHDGKTIEIKGEVFDQPIAKNELMTFFNRILLIDRTNFEKPGYREQLWGTKMMFFEFPFTEEEMDKNIQHIKQNIADYKGE
jgi:hypothetical protein